MQALNLWSNLSVVSTTEVRGLLLRLSRAAIFRWYPGETAFSVVVWIKLPVNVDSFVFSIPFGALAFTSCLIKGVLATLGIVWQNSWTRAFILLGTSSLEVIEGKKESMK